jgi:linoleoyl-CoA desaturase
MEKRKPIRFIAKERNLFFITVKKRVDAYFEEKQLSKHANFTMVVKTIVLLGGYIMPFVLMLLIPVPFWASMLLWAVMGVSLAGVGMSVMHDANHGAYSGNQTVNIILGYTLGLLGGSTHNWKIQHNVLHHNFTNIAHVDEDINNKVFLKLSPHHDGNKGFLRFQHIYAFLLYSISTLYWVVYKDFPQFIRYVKGGLNKDEKPKAAAAFALIVLHKLAYLFVFLVMPTLFFGVPFYTVLAGFMLMHALAGLILTMVFQLAHTVEGTTHPLPNVDGIVENDWAVHQMNTTVNFSPNSKLISWYVGGLNFQVEHHLFPKVCHVHYPQIAAIVKQTAFEFGVPYLQNDTFMQALSAHIAALQRFGMVDLDEAIV